MSIKNIEKNADNIGKIINILDRLTKISSELTLRVIALEGRND